METQGHTLYECVPSCFALSTRRTCACAFRARARAICGDKTRRRHHSVESVADAEKWPEKGRNSHYTFLII